VGVLLVIPCFNEHDRLPRDCFVRSLDEQADLELLFVDDGSTDGTLTLLRGICDERPGRADVLALTANRGKPEAVRLGMLAGLERRPEFIGYWDADLATPLGAVADFLRVFATRPEIELVIGSRVRLLGREIDRHPLRHYVGRIFATFASLTLDLPVYDTQCGAKLFRVSQWTPQYFTEAFVSGWAFDVEILARMRLERVGPSRDRVYELVLRRWSHVPGSKVKPFDFLRACRDLVRIRRRNFPRRRAARRRTTDR
jgi:glycosyltransferase involved in cell wall biosynthesis